MSTRNPPTDTTPSQTTVSIPSLLIFALLAILTIRYFFFSSTSSSTSSATSTAYPGSSTTRRDRNRIPNDKIEQVLQMFPQLSRRDVEWDLRRNGGSVQASCERVLRVGGLEGAPPSFRPQTPPPQAPSPLTSHPITPASTSKHPDLITRYNLSSRLPSSSHQNQNQNPTSSSSSSTSSTTGTGARTSIGQGKVREGGVTQGGIQTTQAQRAKGEWSSSKTERAELLKRRREEMVLEARRRLVEREGKGGGGGR